VPETRPDPGIPELLLRESASGWACYGAVPVRDLIRRLEAHRVAEIVVYDAERNEVLGVLTRSDLRHLTHGRPRAPLRTAEVEWLVKGTMLRLDGDPLREPDIRAVLLLGAGRRRARPGAIRGETAASVIALRRANGS
jgi:hypothetical protein